MNGLHHTPLRLWRWRLCGTFLLHSQAGFFGVVVVYMSHNKIIKNLKNTFFRVNIIMKWIVLKKMVPVLSLCGKRASCMRLGPPSREDFGAARCSENITFAWEQRRDSYHCYPSVDSVDAEASTPWFLRCLFIIDDPHSLWVYFRCTFLSELAIGLENAIFCAQI